MGNLSDKISEIFHSRYKEALNSCTDVGAAEKDQSMESVDNSIDNTVKTEDSDVSTAQPATDNAAVVKCEKGVKCEKDTDSKVEQEKTSLDLLHDVAALHARTIRQRKELKELVQSVGPFRRALCAQRDLAMRKAYCKIRKTIVSGSCTLVLCCKLHVC